MKGFGKQSKPKKKKINNNQTKLSKEEIINKAFRFHSKGNIQTAAKYYQYCINQGFRDQRVFLNFGVILKNLGRLQEAELSYRKAIDIKPDYAEAHSNLGMVLKNLGRLQEAELSLRKAIDIKSDYAEAHYNLGNLFRDLCNFQEAELSYRKAINIKPDYAKAHSNLGIVLKNLGRLQEAELSFRKTIDFKPDYAEAHYNLGNLFSDLCSFEEAELSYRKAINIKPDYAEAHYNLGIVFKNLGSYQEAELSYRKAIDIKPDYAEAHSNLGNVFRDLGRLQKAELYYCKAIELNPNYSKAYYSLSLLKNLDKKNIWENQLFSESIIKNNSENNQIDIYFARANILHKKKNYKESSRFLKLANNLKLAMKPSIKITDKLINNTKTLLFESNQENINKKEHENYPESIFIVGMPRCGSTLVESIISIKDDVYDLGEINILEEAFREYDKNKKDLNLAELYWEKVNNKTGLNITTNKYLLNYQYAGIIAQHIPNAKIIHCYRNPLDNILSIYRAHFAQGNEYSSSLVDCTTVYLNQEEVMREYKDKFKSKIYDLNYDELVRDPQQEIKSLITWLNWKWEDTYLNPHLNQRTVSTRSNVEIRSPINSKSVNGWKNYKDMLKPAIEILSQTERNLDLL